MIRMGVALGALAACDRDGVTHYRVTKAPETPPTSTDRSGRSTGPGTRNQPK